jgi:putative nucleotidyltransferase with HDIG domain
MKGQDTIKKVDVNNLKVGMYVSQLDRPWLETGFFFNKFLIKSDKQLEKVRRYCRHVYIDTSKGEDVKTSIPLEDEEDKKIEAEMKEKIEDALKRNPPSEDEIDFSKEIKEAKKVHDEAKNFVKTMLDDIKLGKSISSTDAKKVVDNMTDSVMRNRDALLCLAQLKKTDEYTSFHSLSVSVLCLAFGRNMGYQKNTLKALGLGGLLHDVGKMKIPSEVLNKAGRLTETEFELMKRHVDYGAEILSSTGIHESALEAPLQHHERYNGTGYPKGLKGDKISVFGMLASIADVYDAITSNRVYNSALQPQEALKRMFEWRGKDFHPLLLERFIQCVGIYPIGSVVRFQSGEAGLVMSINMMNITRPKVLMFLDASLSRINPYKMVDLCSPDSSKYSIKEVLNTDKYGINIQEDFKGVLLDEHIRCC